MLSLFDPPVRLLDRRFVASIAFMLNILHAGNAPRFALLARSILTINRRYISPFALR